MVDGADYTLVATRKHTYQPYETDTRSAPPNTHCDPVVAPFSLLSKVTGLLAHASPFPGSPSRLHRGPKLTTSSSTLFSDHQASKKASFPGRRQRQQLKAHPEGIGRLSKSLKERDERRATYATSPVGNAQVLLSEAAQTLTFKPAPLGTTFHLA